MFLTHLLYLGNLNLLECEAEVLEVLKEAEKDVVILDQTVFYPQGGGQPYDQGMITGSSAKFLVQEVRFVEGVVRHIGEFEEGVFRKGERVRCFVNQERRVLHSRLHSAGHVVDMAVSSLDLPWIPGKGYHFPNGPYVEYSGTVEDSEKEKLRVDIQDVCNGFIDQAIETKPVLMAKEKMHEVCRFVPDYFPEGKPTRVVMYGDFGVPCGGTHVVNLRDIGHLTIRKISNKKGLIPLESSSLNMAKDSEKQSVPTKPSKTLTGLIRVAYDAMI